MQDLQCSSNSTTNQSQLIDRLRRIFLDTNEEEKLKQLQSLVASIFDRHTLLIALSQSETKGHSNLLDELIRQLFIHSADIDDVLIEVIHALFKWGSFSNYTIPTLFQTLAKDYKQCKVDIIHLKKFLAIIDGLFTFDQKQVLWPYQMLYFQTADSSIKVQHSASATWPFTKGMVLVMWIYVLQEKDQKDCNLFKITVGNTFKASINLVGQTISYNSTYQKCTPEQVNLGDIPMNKWIYLRWDLRPLQGQRYGLKMQIDDKPCEEQKVTFPSLQGSYQFEIIFASQFVGYISSIILFREQISFNPIQLLFGIQSESQLKNLFKMMDQDFNQIYILFTPLRVGDMCYDVVGLNHGEFVGSVGHYANNLCLRKWKNIMSLQYLFPLFHFLKYIRSSDYPEYLNQLLGLLIKVFKNKSESQQEANQLDFFALISHFIIKGDHGFFTQNSIHKMAELYKCLLDRNLKEKMMTDMIWALTRLNFHSSDLFEEYFQLIRVICIQNPIQCLQQYSISDILNQLVGLDESQIFKSKLYFNLIESISSLVANQQDQNKKLFLKSTVLQLLKFLYIQYSTAINLGILSVLQVLQSFIKKSLIRDSECLILITENLTQILIISFDTLSPEVKASSMNLIQKLVKSNNLDESDICCNLNNMFKSQEDLEDFQENEIIISKKYIEKFMTNAEFQGLQMQITIITNSLYMNYESNKLQIQQDQQIFLRSALNQQRKSWNTIFSQIGVWNSDTYGSCDNELKVKHFDFKISNYMTKSKVRPYMKLKRQFTVFDDIPILKEEAYRSVIDEVCNEGENVCTSPFRKREQLFEDEVVKPDLMFTFVNFIKDLGSHHLKNGVQFHQVQWIKTLTCRNGTLEISNNKIRFMSQPLQLSILFVRHKFPESRQLIRQWSLQDVEFACIRRYRQRKNCLSFTMNDGQSLLFNCKDNPENILQEVISLLMIEKHKNCHKMLTLSTSTSMDSYFEKQKKTQKWQSGLMSNMAYLLYLNDLAGRNCKDLTQYPVLPWILKKYHGEKLDIDNDEVYRDLSKPMGACGTPDRSLEFQQKFYNSFVDSEGIPAFHYGSHYSNPGIVMHYLVRLQPYSRGARELQSGKWDLPDRLFHSVKELHFNATNEMSDIRELIPETFVLPEMFLNLQKHNFGHMQTGEYVNDVVLPQYAPNPYNFVVLHRQAIESKYVSQFMHNWIDLIFGYKQKGKAAEENLNQFYYLTYQDAIHLDTVQDLLIKQSLESQIMHFGQTPLQLLTKPHPQKVVSRKVQIFDSDSSIFKVPYKEKLILQEDKFSIFNIFQKQTQSPRSKANKQKKILFMTQQRDQKILFIKKDGQVCIARLFNHQQTQFEFQEEKTFNLNLNEHENERLMKFNPEQPQIIIDYMQKQQILLVGGAWDDDGIITDLYLLARYEAYSLNQGYITAISHSGDFIATGCSDGNLNVWKVDTQRLKLIGSFNDHLQDIQDVDISLELKMVVSCGSDGRINLYNLYNQKYLRSYFQDFEINNIKFIHVPLYGILFYSKLKQTLYVLSINGQLVASFQLQNQIISTIKLTRKSNFDEVIYFVNDKIQVTFMSLPFLDEICKINTAGGQSNQAYVMTLQDNALLLVATREGVVQLFAEQNQFK